MSFEVLLHPQAAKFFRKLPLEEQNRVKIRLNELRRLLQDPSFEGEGWRLSQLKDLLSRKTNLGLILHVLKNGHFKCQENYK